VSVEVTLTPEVRGPLSVYPILSAKKFGIDAFITDRFGGVSEGPYESLNLGVHVGDNPEHVVENRKRVAEAVGAKHLIIVRQVHSSDVVDAAQAITDTEADGLVTSESDVVLCILVADCVPILLFDSASNRFAAVHAGWKGLASGVIASALEHFDAPATVHAFVGPSISLEGYQVGPEVAEVFAHIPGATVSDGGDRSRLDLRHVASHQLLGAGLRSENIEVSRQSTDGGEIFFSDRALRPCGRFALIAKRAS
jgi:hypothetical protein